MGIDLERFKRAQESDYSRALAEITAGRKYSHWMWYIFPQLRGLGRSDTAVYYGIDGIEEATAYWNDPVLSARLKEITGALLPHSGPISAIMGSPDDMKLRSCMTLFYRVSGEPLFLQVLEKFYDGRQDPVTLRMLGIK
jgi:uncharacterized protein (DUF1810 family)